MEFSSSYEFESIEKLEELEQLFKIRDDEDKESVMEDAICFVIDEIRFNDDFDKNSAINWWKANHMHYRAQDLDYDFGHYIDDLEERLGYQIIVENIDEAPRVAKSIENEDRKYLDKVLTKGHQVSIRFNEKRADIFVDGLIWAMGSNVELV